MKNVNDSTGLPRGDENLRGTTAYLDAYDAARAEGASMGAAHSAGMRAAGDATSQKPVAPDADELIDTVERWLSGGGPLLQPHEKETLRQISQRLGTVRMSAGREAPHE